MEQAYGIRIVADYEPKEAVNFDTAKRFSLMDTDVSDAHEWQDQTRILCTQILKVWNEINE